ncbi:hypothetical protein [Pontibacillus salipaludis]
MGCCSPNFNKEVEKQEEKVNEKGNEQIPLWGKVIAIVISICVIWIAFV